MKKKHNKAAKSHVIADVATLSSPTTVSKYTPSRKLIQESLGDLGGSGWAMKQYNSARNNLSFKPLAVAVATWFGVQGRHGRTQPDIAAMLGIDLQSVKAASSAANNLSEDPNHRNRKAFFSDLVEFSSIIRIETGVSSAEAIEKEALGYCLADTIKKRAAKGEFSQDMLDPFTQQSVVEQVTSRLGVAEDILNDRDKLIDWAKQESQACSYSGSLDRLQFQILVADGCAARVLFPTFVPELADACEAIDKHLSGENGERKFSHRAYHLAADITSILNMARVFRESLGEGLEAVASKLGFENLRELEQHCWRVGLSSSNFVTHVGAVGPLIMSSEQLREPADEIYAWLRRRRTARSEDKRTAS